MAHKTQVVITRYQDKDTGETRTKAEYIIIDSDKKRMSAGQVSEHVVREEVEKNSSEEVSCNVADDSVVETEEEDNSKGSNAVSTQAQTKKDTVVIVVRKGSFSKQLEDFVAASEKRTQQQNKSKDNQDETDNVRETEKEDEDSNKSKNASEFVTKTTNPPEPQTHENSDEKRQSNENEGKEPDQGQENATEKLNSEIQKRTDDTVQRQTTTRETQKRSDVNDKREIHVQQNVSGREKVVKEMPASKKDRLAKLYEQISLKRKQKQQLQK